MPETIHKCKCHEEPYTVCPLCGCQYCAKTWPACPRTAWSIAHVPAPPPPPLPSLQGWPVVHLDTRSGGAVYVRIPPDLRRDCGGCRCAYCVAHPDETPTWDTLGIPLETGREGRTWTCHAPEWGTR